MIVEGESTHIHLEDSRADVQLFSVGGFSLTSGALLDRAVAGNYRADTGCWRCQYIVQLERSNVLAPVAFDGWGWPDERVVVPPRCPLSLESREMQRAPSRYRQA